MGFTPQQVNAMSIWEFASCVAAHRTKEPADISEAALADLGIEGFEHG